VGMPIKNYRCLMDFEYHEKKGNLLAEIYTAVFEIYIHYFVIDFTKYQFR
jgi:hypothetical protein